MSVRAAYAYTRANSIANPHTNSGADSRTHARDLRIP